MSDERNKLLNVPIMLDDVNNEMIKNYTENLETIAPIWKAISTAKIVQIALAYQTITLHSMFHVPPAEFKKFCQEAMEKLQQE